MFIILMMLVGTLTAVNVTTVAFAVALTGGYVIGGGGSTGSQVQCIRAPCEFPPTISSNTVSINGSSTGSQVQCIRAPCEFPPTSSSNTGGINDMKGLPSSLSSTNSSFNPSTT